MKHIKNMGFSSTNWNTIYYAVFLIVIVHIQGLSSTLSCYRCLNLECPASEESCNEVREFIISELRAFYYMREDLEPCPSVDDKLAWRLSQLEGTCCDSGAQCPHVTCTLGRLRVISQVENLSKKIVSHGTVLGCANQHLLKEIRDANVYQNACDMQRINGSSKSESKHSLSLEHCNQITDSCHDRDFCVDFENSVVKTFKDSDMKGSFDFGILIGIVITVVVLILAIMAASMCWGPLNKAHNFSKPTEPVAFTGFSDIESPPNYPNTNDAGSSTAALVPRNDTGPKSPGGPIINGPAAVPVPIPTRPERRSSYI